MVADLGNADRRRAARRPGRPAADQRPGTRPRRSVAARGKNLTAVCLTHGPRRSLVRIEPDPRRFPDAQAVAVPAVIEHVREQFTQEVLASFWNPRFPGQMQPGPR